MAPKKKKGKKGKKKKGGIARPSTDANDYTNNVHWLVKICRYELDMQNFASLVRRSQSKSHRFLNIVYFNCGFIFLHRFSRRPSVLVVKVGVP